MVLSRRKERHQKVGGSWMELPSEAFKLSVAHGISCSGVYSYQSESVLSQEQASLHDMADFSTVCSSILDVTSLECLQICFVHAAWASAAWFSGFRRNVASSQGRLLKSGSVNCSCIVHVCLTRGPSPKLDVRLSRAFTAVAATKAITLLMLAGKQRHVDAMQSMCFALRLCVLLVKGQSR